MSLLERSLAAAMASVLLLEIGCRISPTPSKSSSYVPTVYVLQNGLTSTVFEFASNSTDNAEPTATLTISPGSFQDNLAVDSTGNIYVATDTPVNEILVFAPGASTGASPVRTITNLPGTVSAMTVDTQGQLYAITSGKISVFAPGANGSAVPTRQIVATITGPITTDNAGNIYTGGIDTAGGTFADDPIAFPSSIQVFSPSATGSAVPERVIEGWLGELDGLAVDAAGDIFASSYFPGGLSASEISEFGPGANGVMAPIKSFNSFTIGPYGAGGIALDATGVLYAVNTAQIKPTIDIFSSADLAAGSAPSGNISSPVWIYGEGMIAVH